MITLNSQDIIGEGTSRIVFNHPNDEKKCIKVSIRDKLILKKTRRGVRALFHPLSYFDPTKFEVQLFLKLERRLGKLAFIHIPRFYETIETNFGRGAVFEKVGDENLETYLKVNSFDDRVEKKLIRLRDFFIQNRIHFSDWRPSNFVVKKGKSCERDAIFAVDGFEYTEFVPITRIPYFSKKKMLRRSLNMISRLREQAIHKRMDPISDATNRLQIQYQD